MNIFFIVFLLFRSQYCAELRKVKLNLDDSQIGSEIKIKRHKVENELDLKIGTEEIDSKKFFNEAYEQKNLFEGFFKSQKNLKKNFKIYQNRNLVRSRQIEQTYDLNGDYPKIFHILNENKELGKVSIQNENQDIQFINGVIYRQFKVEFQPFLYNTGYLNQEIQDLNENEQDTLLRFRDQIDIHKIRQFILPQKKQTSVLRKLHEKRKHVKNTKKDSSKTEKKNDEQNIDRKLPQKRQRLRKRKETNKQEDQVNEKPKRLNVRQKRKNNQQQNQANEQPERPVGRQNKRTTPDSKNRNEKNKNRIRSGLQRKRTQENLSKNVETVDKPSQSLAKRNQNVKGATNKTAGYHSVNITFDKSLMDYHLRTIVNSASVIKKIIPNFKNKREAETKISQYLDNLLQRGNGVLRKYILFKDELKKQPILIKSNGPRCYSTPLFNPENKGLRGKAKKYEADTVIFVDIIYKPNSPVLAEAAACDKNRDNQAQIGQMAINIAKINFQNEDHFSLYTNLMTVVHEVFHIFGFSPTFNVKVKKMAADSDNDYLSKLKKLPPNLDPLIADEHWEPSLIPNDLMVPQERIDAILSIFSLEYLENISKKIKTNKQNLQDNFLMDDINDYSELFTYKCTDKKTKQRPKFPFYCNEQEKRSRNISCDASYVYKAYCGAKLKNGCYERISMKNEICMNQEQISKNKFEVYGPDSRCFEVQLKNKQQAFCLKFTIDSSSVLVHLQNSQIVTCLRSKNVDSDMERNQRIQQGDLTIYCPNYERFVGSVKMTGCKDFCNGNGFCSNGECQCFDGYDSKDNCKSYLKTHEDITLFSKFAQVN